MGNIILLDDLTINKIAAGEVVERPASVVKELVENSIDAGATNISVDIKNGGISFIRITDNGGGIGSDDMEVAFERHSTSKIRVADDLESVKSMGFRGEALASIAAISNVEMISRTNKQEVGNKIVVQAGDILERQEIGCQVGTTITVQNLFFNTPVRYKFLKKDYTESGYIEDVIIRLALINPSISFKLINNNKTIIQTSGNEDIKSVIYNIYGKDISNGVLNVDYIYDDIKITGVVGKPEIARSNRSNQLFFVNNRYVKDKTLSSSVEQAFKGILPVGKFGFLVINIELSPSKVDVNVHPAKLEVRFSEDNKVFKAVYHAIKEALLKGNLISNAEKDVSDQSNEEFEEQKNLNFSNVIDKKDDEKKFLGGLFKKKSVIMENNIEYDNRSEINNKDKDNFIEQIYNSRKEIHTQPLATKVDDEVLEELSDNTSQNEPIENKKAITPSEEQVVLATQIVNKINNDETIQQDNFSLKEMINQMDKKIEETVKKPQYFDEMYIRTFGKISAQNDKLCMEVSDIAKQTEMDFKIENQQEKTKYKFIGIVFSTYIIIEIENEMYIIDQHAAHERIMYEKVKKNFYNNMEKDSQLMLLPDIITLTHKEMDITKENMDMFKKAGFILEEFGENTIKLVGVPNICIELNTKELFLETLDAINTVAITALKEKEEKFIATIACKASVKANMVLSKEEVESLMDNLLKLPNPFTCPHGRPTVIKMSKLDIEKKFLRK